MDKFDKSNFFTEHLRTTTTYNIIPNTLRDLGELVLVLALVFLKDILN